jgi:hypothetical protein
MRKRWDMPIAENTKDMPNVLTITIAYDKVINIYALQDVYNDCFLFYIFKSK